MRILILVLLLATVFEGFSQNNSCNNLLETLEKDIVFNEYLTKKNKTEKINQFIRKVKKEDFEKKELLLKYAHVNLLFTQNENDQALYESVELTEICDTINQTELRIYLGSLLLISSVLRENNANELSYKYIKQGISIIERKKLTDYSWIQEFYNDAGVDLLSIGEYEKSRIALTKALTFKYNKDYLRDAMIEFNLSFLHYELNNIDSAIFHQKKTCSYFEKIKDLNSYPEIAVRYANSKGSLAIFYYSNNNPIEAQISALEAQDLYKGIDIYDSGRYPFLFTLINLAIDNKDEAQIQLLLKEIKITADKIKDGKYNFYQLLSDSYNAIGNTELESYYLRLAYNQFQDENTTIVSQLQKYNSRLQSQMLQREKNRFQNEKNELKRKALFNTSIISLLLISLITILYILYIRTRNKKNLLEKEKEISRIEYEKNEIKSKLTESELNEKRLITNRLASHIKLKQQTESTFLQKIKELKRNPTQNIESEISELQVKMMNLINIDQNLEQHLEVNEINMEFRLKLKKNHPKLTEKELQFCSYLLLNLTAKEISSITNQNDGAIRVYKNRLKNKLLGKEEIDLVDYLQNI